MIILVVTALQASNVKTERQPQDTKLYEVRVKPEDEDTQLWTGSDTVWSGQGRKSLEGREKPLKERPLWKKLQI